MKRFLVVALALAVLAGCGAQPMPIPTLAPTPVLPPTPILTAEVSPWENFDAAWEHILIAGIPINEPLDTLDPTVLDALGEGEEMSAEEFNPPWSRKLYSAPGLELETAILDKQILDDMLGASNTGEGSFSQGEYDAALGTEYIYRVRLVDDTYATASGLKVGDTLERCHALWYAVPEEGVYSRNVMTFSLDITMEDGVVTEIISQNGGRNVGPLYW
ncbi:MAG: hypothetical protein EOM52_08665 [Clostridia bacterium]|nr:hypothetical protein [Clostridia bacterium]